MTDVAVRARGLGKRFGRNNALIDLDLDVRRGEVLGYLGPNGAGKTTTLRLLLGFLRPTAGSATIFGIDATASAAQAHRRLAFVPGEAALWPALTGAETLHLLARLHGTTDSRYRDELIERFLLDPSKTVRSYSKGNRQKVVLIAALATRADLLLLDEPTSGLDPLMEQQFRRCVAEARDRGQTVLLSSHELSEVQAVSDRVAILRAGRLVEIGTLAELTHLSALVVEVECAGPVPDLIGVPGVEDVRTSGRTVSCRLRGPMKPLLDLLADHDVVRVLSREPSLEELFLAYYGDARDVTGSDAEVRVRA